MFCGPNETYRETYLCGSLGAHFFVVPRFPSKSGLIHKHIVKHIAAKAPARGGDGSTSALSSRGTATGICFRYSAKSISFNAPEVLNVLDRKP
jgi:hypothetical protein